MDPRDETPKPPDPEDPNLSLSREGSTQRRVEQLAESIVDGRDLPTLDASFLPDPASGTEILNGLRRIAEVEKRFRQGRAGTIEQIETDSIETESVPSGWGPLQLLGVLGRGSYGTVYEAHDPALNRRVALKLWNDSGAGDGRDLLIEARRLAQVRHPNVLSVHGAAVHDGRAGYWADLVEGATLGERVGSGHVLGQAEAVAVGLEICRALAAVHAEALVHGDVKPANIVRSPEGHHVLLDFGSSLFADYETPLTASPATAAPETLLEGSSSRASDIYSLGVVLFYLLTGRYPVPGATREELVAAHHESERIYLRDLRPNVSPTLVAVVDRCLERDPQLRYRTCGQLEQDLVAVLGTGVADATTSTTSTTSTTARPRTSSTSSKAATPRRALVGRLAELRTIAEKLERDRAAWIVGAPGIGKTHLATTLADSLVEKFADGVCFVDLGSVGDASEMEARIARALELSTRSHDPREVLWRYLPSTRHLLVLDNCEEVQAEVDGWTTRLLIETENSVLTTSRKRSGAHPHATILLGPLSVPGESAMGSSGAADSSTDSERLFIESMRLADPGHEPSEGDLEAIGQICRLTEGHPLVIDLVASRCRYSSVQEISADLAMGGQASSFTNAADPGGILDTIGRSSYGRLSPEGRATFRALGVFPGGFTYAAAGSVCEAAEPGGQDPFMEVLDASLVQTLARREGRSPRFTMHPFLRVYARSLSEEAERDLLHARYRDYYLGLAETLGKASWGKNSSTHVAALTEEWENIRGCLLEVSDTSPMARTLGLSLGRYFSECMDRSFASRWIRGVSAAQPDDPDLALMGALVESSEGSDDVALEYSVRARALYEARNDALGSGKTIVLLSHAVEFDDEERAARLRDAVRLLEPSGQTYFLLRAILAVALHYAHTGEMDLAEEWYRKAEFRAREAEDDLLLLRVIVALAFFADSTGDSATEQACYEEALTFGEIAPMLRVATLYNMGVASILEKDWATARSRLEEAVHLGRRSGMDRLVSSSLANLAEIEDDQYDPWRNRETALRQFRSHLSVGERARAIESLTGIAKAAIRLGRMDEAALMLGHLRQAWSDGSGPGEESFATEYLDALEAELDRGSASRWNELHEEGKKLSLEELGKRL